MIFFEDFLVNSRLKSNYDFASVSKIPEWVELLWR